MKKLILIETQANGQVVEYPSIDAILNIVAQPGASYSLIDKDNSKRPKDLILKRDGDALLIEVDGEQVAKIDNFYAENTDAVYSVDGSSTPTAEMSVASNDIVTTEDGAIVWSAESTDTEISPWIWGGAIGAGIGGGIAVSSGGSSSHSSTTPDTIEPYTLTVTAVAGTFTSNVTIDVFDASGNLLTHGVIDPDTGQVTFTISNGYTGPMLIQVNDINGNGGDYVDEATGEATSLGQPLRAMVMANGNADIFVSVTPLTELSVRQSGVDTAELATNNLTATQVATNDAVTELFGVEDITGQVATVLDPAYDESDGVDAAEHYGQVLAMLSGADTTTGSIDATLDQLEEGLGRTEDGKLALNPAGVELLSAGSDAFEAGVNGGDTDLGDTLYVIPVTCPVISSIIIPDAAMNVGDTVTVTITVTDDGGDIYTNLTGSVGGFDLSNLTKISDTTYTAEFTVTESGTDIAAAADIAVSLTLDDSVGNTSSSYTTAITQVNDALDANSPVISSIAITGTTGSQNSTLNNGDVVSVTVTMDGEVTVTGTPQLALNIGGTTVQSDYVSGTTSLIFSYTITSETDINGISIDADSLTGTLTDAAGNSAILTHDAVSNNSGYLVDTTVPTIATIVVSTDDVVNSSDTDTAVTFSGTTTGVEDGQTVTVDIGGVSADITVTSNAFSGTVDLSTVGDSTTLAVTADVSDVAGNAATQFSGTIIKDTAAPTIATLVVSTDDVVNSSDTDTAVTFNGTTTGVEDTQNITVVIGGMSVNATVTGNIFSGTVDLSGVSDSTILAVTADVSDVAGNAATQFTSSILLDTTASIDTLVVSTDDTINDSDTLASVAFSGTTTGVEDGQTVTVDVGGVSKDVTVTGNVFSGTVDLSAVGDNTTLAVTADASDVAGNAATQFSGTIIKDTAAPTIATLVVSTDDVVNSSDTDTAVTFNGTTTGVEDTQNITVVIGGVSVNATVTGNIFSGTVDLSGVSDSTILAVTADVSDVAGNAATQFSGTIIKNTAAPTIATLVVSTDDVVNSSDTDTAVAFSGTTTSVEDTQSITVVIGGVSVTTTVTGNAFSGTVDLSAVGDNTALAVTADVSDVAGNAATQFMNNILLDTAAPTIATLVVSTDDVVNSSDTDTAVTFSGTTTGVEDTQSITVVIGGVSVSTTVTGNVFSGTVDLSAVGDSTALAVTADVSDVAGNVAIQFTNNILLDTAAPTIATLVVSTDDVVNSSDTDTAVTFNGTTTGIEDTQSIIVVIGGVSVTTTVTGNVFSGTVDLSAVGDSTALAVTADVSDVAGNAATQFTNNILLDTAAPTITTLLVSTDDVVNSNDTGTAVTFSGTTTGVEDTQSITVVIGGVSVTTTVTGNAFSGTVDLSAVGDSTTLAVTADVSDVAGNAATQFTNNILLDTTASINTLLVSTDDTINGSDTLTSVAFSGTTTGVEDGQTVTVNIGGVITNVAVASNAFSGTVNLFAVGDSTTLAVTADVSDVAGNAATQFSGTIIKDTAAPTIATLLVSTDDVVNSSDTDTAVTFNGTTTGVEDTQNITVVIGGVSVTTTVTGNAFSGTVDLSGVGDSTTLAVTADVSDVAGNTATQFTNSILLDTTSPVISSIAITDATGRQNNTLNNGDVVSVTVTMDGEVTVTDTPQLALNIGGTTVQANYVSGTTALIFSYTITSETDINGISIDADSLNGTLIDAAGNSAILTHTAVGDNNSYLVDTAAPTVTAFSSMTADGAYTTGDTINITATTDEDIQSGSTLTVTLDTGDSVLLTAAGNGTTLVGTYTVGTDDTSGDLTVNSFSIGSVQDLAGNAMTDTNVPGGNNIADISAIVVDTAPPVISGLSIANSGMKVGDTVSVTLTVDDDGGDTYSNLSGTIGGFALGSLSRSDSTTYTAQFTVTEGGTDVASGGDIPVNLTIDDTAGNTSSAYASAISQNSDAIDANAPSVSSVAITGATGIQNNTLNAGDVVSVTVTMDEATTVIGSPQLALNIGGSTVQADYASGSGTTELVFNYTIQTSQTDVNGISLDANSLQLNSGTLTDAAGNAATLTHNVVADNNSYQVDTTAPTLSSASPSDNATAIAADSNIVLTFSEDIVAGSGDIVISDGAADTRTIDVSDSQVTISGTQVTINPTADLSEGTTYDVSMVSGVLQDSAGNDFAGISVDELDFTTELGLDTSIVVFDLTRGVSSDHSDRIFDSVNDEAYTIYIIVDSHSRGVSLNTDHRWNGGDQLDADDKVILVGTGSDVLDKLGQAVSTITQSSPRVMWFAGGSAVTVLRSGCVERNVNNAFDSTSIWSGYWVTNPNTGATGHLNDYYLTTMPNGILTSQGLA